MNNLKKYFLNKSIGTKLIFYFFSIILLLIFTLSVVGNLLYKNSINNSQNENTKQILKQINTNVDSYIKKTENIMGYLSQDPRILKFFDDNDYNNSDINDPAYDAMYTYTSVNSEVAGIMIVNKNGGYLSDVMNKVSRDSLKREDWYECAEKENDKVHIFVKPVGRNIDNIFKYSADEVISLSKAVIDKKTNEFKGVILIDIKIDFIKSIIENSKPGTAGFIYIMDDEDDIVYTPVNKIVYRIEDNWIEDINDEVIIKQINGENYQLTKAVSDYSGWKTIGVFPESESLKVVKNIQFEYLIIGMCAMIISGILGILFTNTIVNPIYNLKKLMKLAQQGDLNIRFNNKYDDEIGELGKSFNSMVREIKKLIELVHEQEKKKRIAEMNVLQAQIKPHFMYNTLDTIRWMALENNESEIAEIIESFTKLLRISLSKGHEIITVGQEKEHILNYLIIQKIRYEDKLNYEINFDENILNYKVTKLILQPLVENAIYHGIKEKRGNGRIIINGNIQNGHLHFSVSDNGKGIEEDLLNKINETLKNHRADDNEIGYGIFNVNERIKLMYGDQYGLKYKSVYGEGTTVEVELYSV